MYLVLLTFIDNLFIFNLFKEWYNFSDFETVREYPSAEG